MGLNTSAVEKVRGLLKDESGATMVEYAIMVGFIAAVCVLIIAQIGVSTKSKFESAETGFD